jgi:hypothetical protein
VSFHCISYRYIEEQKNIFLIHNKKVFLMQVQQDIDASKQLNLDYPIKTKEDEYADLLLQVNLLQSKEREVSRQKAVIANKLKFVEDELIKNGINHAFISVKKKDSKAVIIDNIPGALEELKAIFPDAIIAGKDKVDKRTIRNHPEIVEKSKYIKFKGEVSEVVTKFIYFIKSHNSGLIKIGTTVNLQERVRSLQTGSPEEIYVVALMIGDHKLEKQIHKKFQHLRRGDSEWFEPNSDLMDFIKENAKSYN